MRRRRIKAERIKSKNEALSPAEAQGRRGKNQKTLFLFYEEILDDFICLAGGHDLNLPLFLIDMNSTCVLNYWKIRRVISLYG